MPCRFQFGRRAPSLSRNCTMSLPALPDVLCAAATCQVVNLTHDMLPRMGVLAVLSSCLCGKQVHPMCAHGFRRRGASTFRCGPGCAAINVTPDAPPAPSHTHAFETATVASLSLAAPMPTVHTPQAVPIALPNTSPVASPSAVQAPQADAVAVSSAVAAATKLHRARARGEFIECHKTYL